MWYCGCKFMAKKIRRGRPASADLLKPLVGLSYLPVATTVPVRSTMETLVMVEPGVQ
jgi:hypothetical protein